MGNTTIGDFLNYLHHHAPRAIALAILTHSLQQPDLQCMLLPQRIRLNPAVSIAVSLSIILASQFSDPLPQQCILIVTHTALRTGRHCEDGVRTIPTSELMRPTVQCQVVFLSVSGIASYSLASLTIATFSAW